jgi:uncharacterized membrane protein YkvA (DUF1232 family)
LTPRRALGSLSILVGASGSFMRLSFELSDRDLRYFRVALKQSREAVRDAEEQEILDAIRHVLDEIRSNEPLPDFVAERLPQLETMIEMLIDAEWKLPKADREQLLAMFVYFSDPEDLLPDDLPVIGYLDDVIIIELIMRELRHVREAYNDFCAFRDEFDHDNRGTADVIRRDRLDRKRQQLHQRMKRRAASSKKSGIW